MKRLKHVLSPCPPARAGWEGDEDFGALELGTTRTAGGWDERGAFGCADEAERREAACRRKEVQQVARGKLFVAAGRGDEFLRLEPGETRRQRYWCQRCGLSWWGKFWPGFCDRRPSRCAHCRAANWWVAKGVLKVGRPAKGVRHG